VATLRKPSSSVLSGLFASAIVVVPTWLPAAEPGSREAPLPLLRMPNWIESLGFGGASRDRDDADEARQDDGLLQVAGVEKEPASSTKADAATNAPTNARDAAEAAGSPEGPVRRWFNERVAGLPTPTALFGGKPAAPAPAPEEPEEPPVEPRAAQEPETPATVNAPVAVTPDEMPTLPVDPASFRGVHPGKTTRAEIEANWGPGEPIPGDDGIDGLAWTIEPFERVEVTVEQDVVTSIRIKLAESVAIAELANQLEIADLPTVSILDEEGVVIGEVYPERGVILSIAEGTKDANAIMIEPLDPEAFVLRAEGEMETSAANAMADLLYAIQLDPRHVRAHRLLLAMTSEQGKWDEALKLAETAVRLDPQDVWTHIKHAGVLLAVDRPADAVAVLERLQAEDGLSPLVTAQVQRLLGRAAMAGSEPDHQAAVEHFAEAIRRAAPLAAKKSPSLQAAATEVLLGAHLGTAEAIAEGTWQQKGRVIPKWVTRAETLVAEFDGSETESLILQLQLCRGVLAASAGSNESVEPLPWVKRLLELREQMGEAMVDPWRRRQIDWEVGLGLKDALTAAEMRGDATDMLDNCTLTAAYLERGAEHRELTAAERREFGELLFRIGIMHSLQRGDHATAVTWFDRAVPLWEADGKPDVAATHTDPGRLGESYVSMAISYWQVERREDALALSRRGVDLMVAAVEGDALDERALAVAYGNLATMYAEEGNEQQSRAYADLASRAEAAGTTVR
jgi:tetratricopeptide (TPR) repeat protein